MQYLLRYYFYRYLVQLTNMSKPFHEHFHGNPVQLVCGPDQNGSQVAQSLAEDKQVFLKKIKSFNRLQIILDKKIARANSEQNVTMLLKCSKDMIRLSDERVAFIEAYANDKVMMCFIFKNLVYKKIKTFL